MRFVDVNEFLGHVILLRSRLFLQVDVQILPYVHVGAPLVIELWNLVGLVPLERSLHSMVPQPTTNFQEHSSHYTKSLRASQLPIRRQ